MKVQYDSASDTLTMIFRESPVVDSDEAGPGLVLDYDAAGNIVAIEVLDASTRVDEPSSVSLATG